MRKGASPPFLCMTTNIRFEDRDITTVTDGIIMHGCNAARAMNSGVAKDLRASFPQIFDKYVAHLDAGYGLGTTCWVQVTPTLLIANSITQQSYGAIGSGVYASVSAIVAALKEVMQRAAELDAVLYMPRIGGLRGGLNFTCEVLPAVEYLSQEHNVAVVICDKP